MKKCVWQNVRLEVLDNIAKELIEEYSKASVFCFFGEMGAGKTTFIKEIIQVLGSNDVGSSPTFGIVNEYETINGARIFHFDCYRIEDEEEAYGFGIEEYLNSGDKCLIEWPENIYNLLPSNYVRVQVEIIDEETRIITASYDNV